MLTSPTGLKSEEGSRPSAGKSRMRRRRRRKPCSCKSEVGRSGNEEGGRRLPKGLSGTGMRVDLKGSPKDRLLALRPERSYGGNISVSSTEGKGHKRLKPGESFADKRGIDRRSPVSTAEERRP